MRFSSNTNSRPLNHWDALKLLAIALMVVDHYGHFFAEHELWLRAIGRACAPIFMFFAGFASSYRFKLDIFLLAALLSLLDFMLLWEPNTLNMLFTIIAYRALFDWMERRDKTIRRPYEWLVGSIALIATMFVTQYGSLGMMFAVAGYMARRPAQYTRDALARYLAVASVCYGVIQVALFEFSLPEIALMAASLAIVCALMFKISARAGEPVHWPKPLVALALPLTRYAAYFYVAHILLFEWMTYKQL